MTREGDHGLDATQERVYTRAMELCGMLLSLERRAPQEAVEILIGALQLLHVAAKPQFRRGLEQELKQLLAQLRTDA